MTSQTQKKLDRLTGTLGVDVIDELGAVPGDLLHADALRKKRKEDKEEARLNKKAHKKRKIIADAH